MGYSTVQYSTVQIVQYSTNSTVQGVQTACQYKNNNKTILINIIEVLLIIIILSIIMEIVFLATLRNKCVSNINI